MTNKRKVPPPMPFFAVSEQINEPRRSKSEARENGFMDVIINDSQAFEEVHITKTKPLGGGT
ncbi:MAG: hypothetical protein K2K13_05835 [Clostridiales bacterium]|nr:hypothetical protein [Clostridiales bacterium]